MDANGQRFWLLGDAAQFDPGGWAWDSERRVLHLPSRGPEADVAADRDAARALSRRPRAAVDAFGTWAAASPVGSGIAARGALPVGDGSFDETPPEILLPEENGRRILDLAAGSDDVLYALVSHAGEAPKLLLIDRRERWLRPFAVEIVGFAPDLLVPHPDGGVWLLERNSGRIDRLRGLPLRDFAVRAFADDVFRPEPEDPDPPRLERVLTLDLAGGPLDGGEIVAAAADPSGTLAVLAWPAAVDAAAAVLLVSGRSAGGPVFLQHTPVPGGLPTGRTINPWTIGWVGGARWAVRVAGHPTALVYEMLPARDGVAAAAARVGDRYPLVDGIEEPFCNALLSPVRYLSLPRGRTVARPRSLHRLSMPATARTGRARARHPIDSGDRETLWHRLYLEGVLPPGTGVKVALAAGDDAEALAAAPDAEHWFGDVPGARPPGVPRGTWIDRASELPLHPGLIGCPRARDRSGLFVVLIQRAETAVRGLRGRYLRVTLELLGNAQVSPQVAAVRVYASRFCYADHYLPSLYRETAFGEAADEKGRATPADFLQRFLALFEGVLTPIEDLTAAAHLMTDPRTVPEPALNWLAGWLGLTLEPGLPAPRRRRMLEQATRIYRRHGTLPGLRMALDAATGEMVARREIVVLEDFRLRRTFATILGADLADSDDPLLAGLVASGNAFVGQTLFLGEEEKKEFLALFRPEAETTAAETEAVTAFFERLSHRISILVHRRTDDETFRLIRRIAQTQTPAHVQVRVLAASHPLLLGVSALLGVDTHLRTRQQPRSVRVAVTRVGEGDRIRTVPSLDHRLEGGNTP